MTILGFSETWVTPLLRRWWTVTLLGIALSVVGIVILVNPFDSVRVLAVLVAVGLALTAADEIAQAQRHAVRWPSYALAAIWLLTAVVALVWPEVTLWALAVAVGVGLIVGGIAEFVFAFRFHRELPRWGLWWLDGLLAIGVGIAALVWPDVTLVALAVLLGLRVALRGLATISFGLGLRQLGRMTAPHVPT